MLSVSGHITSFLSGASYASKDQNNNRRCRVADWSRIPTSLVFSPSQWSSVVLETPSLTVIQLWTRLLRIIYLSGCCPLDLQSKLLRMLLLKKVSYMPVVRWQGWKAATGKWQHRCRKDDCDTSENPNGDIKASSYVKLCLSGAKLLKHAMGIHPCRILFSFFSFLSMLSQPLWQNEGSRQTFPFKQESRKAGQELNLISTSLLMWTWDRKQIKLWWSLLLS